MGNIRIDALDFRALQVLASLARTCNTYRSAEELHLSQSAVSRTLGRLRDILGDPLFIRTASGLEATEFAERVVARLPELFDLLEETLDPGGSFDPARWQGDVSIALNSVVKQCWGRELFEALSTAAPGVVWSFQTWNDETVPRILDGRIAMGLHFRNEGWPQSLYQQPVAEQEFLLMVRAGHPLAGGIAAPEHFDSYPLVALLLPDWNAYGNVLEEALGRVGISPRVRLRTDSMAMALDILRGGDDLMAGTSALVDAESGLARVALPPGLDIPDGRLVACCPRRARLSPRQQWLQECVADVLSGSGSELPG